MVTVKISEEARNILRLLSAFKGKPMYDVAEELFKAEAKKTKLFPRTAKNGKQRGGK